MKLYETTYIIDAQLEDAAIEERVQRITDFLSSHAQEVIKIDRWGERRLAYEIKKRQQGYYVFTQYRADKVVVNDLEQMLRLDEGILRYLTVISRPLPEEEPIEEEAGIEEEQEADESEEDELEEEDDELESEDELESDTSDSDEDVSQS